MMLVIDLNLLYALLFVLVLIIVDVLLGVSVALKNGTFDLKKLPQFLKTQILPYFLSLSSLVGLAQLKDLQNLGTVAVAWAAIMAYAAKMLWVDIGQKLKTLFGVDATG